MSARRHMMIWPLIFKRILKPWCPYSRVIYETVITHAWMYWQGFSSLGGLQGWLLWEEDRGCPVPDPPKGRGGASSTTAPLEETVHEQILLMRTMPTLEQAFPWRTALYGLSPLWGRGKMWEGRRRKKLPCSDHNPLPTALHHSSGGGVVWCEIEHVKGEGKLLFLMFVFASHYLNLL